MILKSLADFNFTVFQFKCPIGNSSYAISIYLYINVILIKSLVD